MKKDVSENNRAKASKNYQYPYYYGPGWMPVEGALEASRRASDTAADILNKEAAFKAYRSSCVREGYLDICRDYIFRTAFEAANEGATAKSELSQLKKSLLILHQQIESLSPLSKNIFISALSH